MENNQLVHEEEIDLGKLLRAIFKRWYFLLLAAIIGGAVAFGYTKFCITPLYQSTARIMVLSKDTTISSLADLQIGSQLTEDYKELITAPDVLDKTISDLQLQMERKELKKEITINNPSNTRILEITVTDESPEGAANIANAIASNGASFITDVMEVSPPNVFSNGEPATEKASPSTSKNTAIGAILGALLVAIIIVVRSMLDDVIHNEEDVETYLGLRVLASVPDRNLISKSKGYGYGYGKKGSKKK